MMLIFLISCNKTPIVLNREEQQIPLAIKEEEYIELEPLPLSEIKNSSLELKSSPAVLYGDYAKAIPQTKDHDLLFEDLEYTESNLMERVIQSFMDETAQEFYESNKRKRDPLYNLIAREMIKYK